MIDELHSLSVRQSIGQLFFIGVSGPAMDAPMSELIEQISPGGVCLFARNIRKANDVRVLLDDLRNALPMMPFFSVDQEGGLVDRLRRVVTPMPAACKLKSEEDAARLGDLIGRTLANLGFNMNFAPVVDVVTGQRAQASNGLASRGLGHSKETVVEFAEAFLRSMQAHGVSGCIKHFPGLGAASVDSHEELPLVDISETEFSETDLFPFRRLIAKEIVDAVMVAHAAFPQHSLQEAGNNGKLKPASLSHNFITHLLRDELGYDGLVITDDLEMGAIIKNYGIGEACIMAVGAGADMLAICGDPTLIRDGYEAVVTAFENGDLSEERLADSLRRIEKVKTVIVPPQPFDPAELELISAEIANFNDRLAN